MEHRCGTRHTSLIRASVETRAGVSASCTLQNLSISGAWLQCSLPLQPHQTVHLRLKMALRTGSRRPVTLDARVVRGARDGFGIEWVEFAPPEIQAICRELGGETAKRPEPSELLQVGSHPIQQRNGRAG
jgi:hypothetical protein